MSHERGGMLTELLLTVALAAAILPFVAKMQSDRAQRAVDIAVMREMESADDALERYMDAHKAELLNPRGRNITRVTIADLEPYGFSAGNPDMWQLRILKSADNAGHATLQGIVIRTDGDMSPLRTRQIMNLGDGRLGFAERGRAFGGFGAWRADGTDIGAADASGLVGVTNPRLDQARYIWRVPSVNADDATMLAPLNMAGHNVIGAVFADSADMRFDEFLNAGTIVSDNVTFQNRASIDQYFEAADAAVAGTLSSDGRNLDIFGKLSMTGTGKFSSLTVGDLWVDNLNLPGLSINGDGNTIATLRVNQTIDMVAGHVSAVTATVGFAGSMTPKLTVRQKISDPSDPSYYWDASASAANLNDVTLAELSMLAPFAVSAESGNGRESAKIFGAVAANKNATATDFINAVDNIERTVRAKFYQLNLD